MPNIVVRNEKTLAPALELPEPMNLFRELLRWNPLRDIPIVPERMNFLPVFEVREAKDRFVFIADVPGVKEDDVEITLQGNRLLIYGERKVEKIDETDTVYTAERMYGVFQRAFTLPDGIDPEHIVADLKEGVLTVVVPKAPGMKARKIALKGAKA